MAYQQHIRRYALDGAHPLCLFYIYVHFCYFVGDIDVNGARPIHNLHSLVMYGMHVYCLQFVFLECTSTLAFRAYVHVFVHYIEI